MGFLDDLQRGADSLTKSVTGTVDDTQARYRADALLHDYGLLIFRQQTGAPLPNDDRRARAGVERPARPPRAAPQPGAGDEDHRGAATPAARCPAAAPAAGATDQPPPAARGDRAARRRAPPISRRLRPGRSRHPRHPAR